MSKLMKLKRYGNRKLYNAETHSYVNSSQVISEMKAGAIVLISCHDTGKDVTNEVLKNMIPRATVSTEALIKLLAS